MKLSPALAALAFLFACGGDSGSKVSKQDLLAGDLNCPNGGVALTVDGSTSYVCNGGTPSTGAVALTQLAPGDSHCANGGTAVSNGTITNYVCNGAAGSPGQIGPAGGGLYTSRNNVYCVSEAMPADAGVDTVIAKCRSDRDLPLVGSCDPSPGVSFPISPFYLAVNEPGLWEGMSPGRPADWTCVWVNERNTPINMPGSRANICCIAVP